MAWHPTQADTGAFVAQCPEEIYDPANERVVSIFALNWLQARHWVRVDYNIVLYRIHVPIIVQCQCDCRCLSSKDGTVIWESFGQLAASRLTILEMVVDDRCCPHSRQSYIVISILTMNYCFLHMYITCFEPSDLLDDRALCRWGIMLPYYVLILTKQQPSSI